MLLHAPIPAGRLVRNEKETYRWRSLHILLRTYLVAGAVMLLVLSKHAPLPGTSQQSLLLAVLTIWVYLVYKLDWVEVLRVKYITLSLIGGLQSHSSRAAWL
jgi:hypothetical protein